MKQFTNTYRITISDEMKRELAELKDKYSIKPTAFIRQAIREKIQNDIPGLIKKQKTVDLPF